MLAAPGRAHALARQLAEELPTLLSRRFPGVAWQLPVMVEPMAGASGLDVDLVQMARRKMLDEGWDAAVSLTDLPLHVGHRPVTAHASVALGVGLISVPALGAVAPQSGVRTAVIRLIELLLEQRLSGRQRVVDRRRIKRIQGRVKELAYPMGRTEVPEGGTVRFVAATGPGNLRLLVGMVRTNRPWRLVAGLSRALVAALATAAFTLTSPGVWRIANGLDWVRLLMLSVGAIAGTCVLLIVTHGLWERSPKPEARPRVLLFNLATAMTLGLGVFTHYLALLAITVVSGIALISPNVLAGEIHHAVGPDDYLRVAWLVSILATIGGALGAAVESEAAVREAAYGYRPEER